MTADLRIGLADDQALVRKGLRAVLDAEQGVSVVLEATNGQNLIEQLMDTPVDVVLCDIRMPVMDGIEFVSTLRRGANRLPVVLLTTFNDEGLLEKGVAAGANGFALKDIEPEELLQIILGVANGEKFLSPQPTNSLRSNRNLPEPDELLEPLDTMDLAVLRLMAAGLSNREIAIRLHRAEGTIKNRVSIILYKLQARDRTQAVLKAITCGAI